MCPVVLFKGALGWFYTWHQSACYLLWLWRSFLKFEEITSWWCHRGYLRSIFRLQIYNRKPVLQTGGVDFERECRQWVSNESNRKQQKMLALYISAEHKSIFFFFRIHIYNRYQSDIVQMTSSWTWDELFSSGGDSGGQGADCSSHVYAYF